MTVKDVKRRLLFCTYGFPPIMGPRGLRVGELSRGLAKLGWEIDVLTAHHSEHHPLYDLAAGDTFVAPNITVHRTFPGHFYSRQQRSLRSSSDVPKTNGAVRHATFRRVALHTLAIPDFAVNWLPPALGWGRKLVRSRSYSLILSAGLPFTAHLVGYLLARAGSLPWIAEYGDPFAFNPVSQLPDWRKAVNKWLEARVLRHVTGVVFTTEGTREGYLEHYPFLTRQKTWVVQSGFAPEFYASVPADVTRSFRLVYTGIFYHNRSAEPLLSALSDLRDLNLEVVIAGPTDASFQSSVLSGNRENIQLLGRVSHRHAVALQKSATLLILIGYGNAYQLPLKTFEYLGAQRPILCIHSGSDDLAARLIRSMNTGLITANTREQIVATIRSAYRLWERGRLDSQFDLTNRERFTWSNSAENLHQALITCLP